MRQSTVAALGSSRQSTSSVSAQVFKEDKYLKEAADCAEVIWQRGLLRKGYGICHGTAGNAYAFLSLYKLTQEKKHLYRACKVTPPFTHGCKQNSEEKDHSISH